MNSEALFAEACKVTVHRWTALNLAVHNDWGQGNSSEKRDNMVAEICSGFAVRANCVSTPKNPTSPRLDTWALGRVNVHLILPFSCRKQIGSEEEETRPLDAAVLASSIPGRREDEEKQPASDHSIPSGERQTEFLCFYIQPMRPKPLDCGRRTRRGAGGSTPRSSSSFSMTFSFTSSTQRQTTRVPTRWANSSATNKKIHS
jgi:hypothetical protein